MDVIRELAAEEGRRLLQELEVGIGQPGRVCLDEGDDAVVHRTGLEALLLHALHDDRRDQELVGNAQLGEVRLDVLLREALQHPAHDLTAGSEPGRAVEGREVLREHMAAQRGVHQQARDEARQPGHRTELAVGIQVAAGAQLHAGQVTPFGRIVEIQHHHPAQQPVAEALLARKAAVRHRHQRIIVGQHVDPGKVHIRLA